jgi:hypothetical protein
MSEAQNNVQLAHRKEWQTMTPVDTTTAAGMFVVNDNANVSRFAMYVCSATVHYLYDHLNDAWLPIASGAFTPALTSGACGTYCDWSPAYTATGGSTTTITVALNTHNINGYVVGQTVEFLSGTAANIGLRKTITAISTTGVAGSTITLTFTSACPSVVANNDTFRIMSGSFFIFTSGVVASSFKRFDIGTMSWGSFLSITNLAATWGTDGRMVTPGMVGVSYDSGTADADSSTTALECDGKNWTADQWIGYQVRITGGTGMGQIRVITDNDTDTLTIGAGTDLDATSTFVIEGDENAIYLMGNNTTTTVKYSISGNSWANLSPTTARAGNAVAGMSGDFVGVTGDTGWADITNIKNGRYIYSFRGATSVLDRLNINGGTAGVPTWEVVTYQPSLQTWATGVGTDWDAGTPDIHIAKEGTAAIPQRFYKFDVVKNTMIPITSDWFLGGAALLGNKVWIRCLSSSNLVKWLYVLQSTSQNLRRIMLF